MFAFTGSTGQVGGAVVRALLAQGKQVRALLRDEAKAGPLRELGAEIFLASIEDASRLEIAFEGVEGVFAMTPPFYSAPDPRTENAMALAAIKHALQASHVPRVVFLSSIGAQHEEGTGAILNVHDMEKELFEIPIAAASIRAAYFMENLRPLAGIAKESGQLPSTAERLDHPFAMIATKDIGELAAELLLSSWEGQRIVELSGPREYSMQDAAGVLSKLLGRPVEAAVVPRDERQAMYEKFGLTAGSAEAMVRMADAINSGLVRFEGGAGVEAMRGKTSLEELFLKA